MKNYLSDVYLEKYSTSNKIIQIQHTLALILMPCTGPELVKITTEIFRWIETQMDDVGWAPWPIRYNCQQVLFENSGLSNSPPWRNSLESAFFDLCDLPAVVEGSQKDVRFPDNSTSGACLAAEIITDSVHAIRTLVWAKVSPEDAQKWSLQEYPFKNMSEFSQATEIVHHVFLGIERIMISYGLDIYNPKACEEITIACENYYQKFV